MTSSSEARITLVTETNARDGFGKTNRDSHLSSPNIPTQTKTIGYQYDGLGRVQREVVEPRGVDIAEPSGIADCVTSSAEARITLVTETNARDGFGNITQQTISTVDAPVQSRPTYMLWGELDGANQVSAANGRFPIRVTNALGHQEYREYDARTGAMQRLYGPNGLNTSWIIDGLGRVMKETRADGTMTDTHRVWCTEALCPGGGVLKTVTVTSGAPLAAVVLDVLGRPIKSVQQGFSGQALISATEYTAKGEVHRASRPYVLGDPITWASFTYDALSRVTDDKRGQIYLESPIGDP